MNVRFQMPLEHGAWAILLVPFLSAAAVAATWNLPLLLAGLCVASLFLLRGSLEAQTQGARWSALFAPAHVLLAGIAGACVGLLIFSYRRGELLWLALIGVGLYLTQRLLANHARQEGEKRSLSAELMGVCLLTLSAPMAWIAARGTLIGNGPSRNPGGAGGVQVWLLNLLFFLGGILCVKYRLRSLVAHRGFRGIRERLAFAWPVFAYHLLLAALLGAWIAWNLRTKVESPSIIHAAALGLAFLPALLRAGRLLFKLGKRFPIRRVGWSEIAHAVVFALLLVIAFRWPS